MTTTATYVSATVVTVPVVPGHGFTNPAEDTPDVCQCGAAFFDGFNLQAVKVAHLEAHATA